MSPQMTSHSKPTLLSLFDGSGGFPLAASLCGIEPIYASEIEPYPIAVTRSRFPNMKHLGDVKNINGAEIEPVDIISFGSPCQDLSVAGKRAGLQGSRSSLFLEAIRIIKEMREATNGIYPRFAIFENVPGAFSSHGGEDFHAVLNEFLHIVNAEATIPAAGKDGWSTADIYVGDGWSIAYRVLNAVAWGVAQRRRRIYLVADFRGESAGKILFEREGLRRNPPKSIEAWQGIARTVTSGVGTADRVLYPKVTGSLMASGYNKLGTQEAMNDMYVINDMGGSVMNVSNNVVSTLRAEAHQHQPIVRVSNHEPLTFKIRGG